VGCPEGKPELSVRLKDMTQNRYTDGRYLRENPSWHVEDSPWKAHQIVKILEKNKLHPTTFCEVGCGAGEVLGQLQQAYPEALFKGWDISPQAIALAQTRANPTLSFEQGDLLTEPVLKTTPDDVLLALDVFEHVEDYFAFLRGLHHRSHYVVFHIPLDLSAQAVWRGLPLRWRKEVGHLHYFTRDLALSALQETGYRILDTQYTAYAIDRPAPTLKARLARWPRRLAYALSPDQAALLLGGFCLMVLAVSALEEDLQD
jgi:cyclopropane fatty-acyl-phospholipid synthase-like methyltransferase